MLDRGQSPSDAQATDAPVNDLGRGQRVIDIHSGSAPSFALLGIAADSLDQIESARIALGNQLTALKAGKNLKSPRPSLANRHEYQDQVALFALLKQAEHQAELALSRAVRQHPYYGWISRTAGIGEKQGARLLAAIGDPYWNLAADRPRRGPAELCQYCGHGDPARSRRRKGQPIEYNPTAKMRVHLCAESCIKQRCTACSSAKDPTGKWTPPPEDCSCLADGFVLRCAYDEARVHWILREASDGHKHNHALRLVAKQILKDLWLEGRELAGFAAIPIFRPPVASTSSAQAKLPATPIPAPPEPNPAEVAA